MPKTRTAKGVQTLLNLLPKNYQLLAYETGAFMRSRKVRNPAELIHILFLYCVTDLPLRTVSATFSLLYQTIGDDAIRERLLNSHDYLRTLVFELIDLQTPQVPQSFTRILLCDASPLNGLAAKTADYRIHLAVELMTLATIHLEVTSKKVGESFQRFPLEPGDLWIGDRGYSGGSTIIWATEQGADVLVRLNFWAVRMFHQDERLLPENFVKILKKHRKHEPLSLSVQIGMNKSEKKVDGWVHCCRLPREEAKKQRKKYCDRIKKK